jgi:hypothetical protein
MPDLPLKLEKRLAIIREAVGGMVPWNDAPKQHRQLEEHGLVRQGRSGDQLFAVLVTDEIREMDLQTQDAIAEMFDGDPYLTEKYTEG